MTQLSQSPSFLQDHGFETESGYWEHPETWKSSSNASLSAEDVFQEVTYNISDMLRYVYIKLNDDDDKKYYLYEEDFNFTEIRSRKFGKCFVYDWNLENFTDPITYIAFIL